MAESMANVSERNTQPEVIPAKRESGTTPSTQPGEPPMKSAASERQLKTTASTAPPETEPPAPPATEVPKSAEQLQLTEPPTQKHTESAFDIAYWLSFVNGYAESIDLTLNSEAVYCCGNSIDADSGCIYLEWDIQS